jgi:hypothetical protein
MTNAIHTVSETQGRIISRANALKLALTAKHYDLGIWFTRELAAEWQDRGMAGIAAACWSLQQELQDVAGAYDFLAEARALAVAA